jgi:hypothetical protein
MDGMSTPVVQGCGAGAGVDAWCVGCSVGRFWDSICIGMGERGRWVECKS